MGLDFRNTNTLWASVIVETLVKLGLRTAIICPGSRSAPLAIAFARHPEVKALSILDERSAAFFALGHARRTATPTAIICTSGTAGANFYPAIIEAHASQIPLIALTADRPPELLDCHAGQTIDQTKLFGQYPNWQTTLSLPRLPQLRYLRQTLKFAWEKALWPVPGPVHINCPFQDPLFPSDEPGVQVLQEEFNEDAFFESVQPLSIARSTLSFDQIPIETWQRCSRGLIIAGPAQPSDPLAYCGAVAQLSEYLGWPVIAEGLSPLRNYASLNPYLISSYAIALKNKALAEAFAPEQVIQIGPLPTSKELRAWLTHFSPKQWVIDPRDHNLDSTHGQTISLRTSVEALVEHLSIETRQPNIQEPSYLINWMQIEATLVSAIQAQIKEITELWESKITWLLGNHLPRESSIFISNSMPVRDVEWFWPKSDSHVRPYFNRGANGIDGTLSTAMGMAFGQESNVLLTGDLAFLHDINGLRTSPQWTGHLTVIVVNNDGGGIFEMLPIAHYDPPFEAFFATPQNINIEKLCEAYGVAYTAITDWGTFVESLNPLPESGVRVLELKCDRKYDSQLRHVLFDQLTR